MENSTDHIEHDGIIEEIDNGIAKIRVMTRSACGSCHAKSACNPLDSKEKIYEMTIPKAQQYSVGETVVLRISQGKGLLAVLISYILPVIVLIAALGISINAGLDEGIAGLISLASIGLYFVVIRLFRNMLNNNFKVTMRKK